jgi:hypothetical protein
MDHSLEFVELIHHCRSRCLWFTAPDRMPVEREAQLYALECVERYGNRDDFIRARRLKQWLLQHSNATFVVS